MTISIRFCFAPLLALLVALSGCGGGGSEPLYIDAVKDFSAAADGTTDDEPAIQGAIDFVATHGGGTVYLPAGVYGIARPLILRSNVTLQGAGRGKSVLRTTVKSLAKHVGETPVWAAVAVVAANNVSIADLSIDLWFWRTHANGIAILPAGSFFEGAISTNCTVARVEVLGGGDYHAYMIWNMRGKGIRIVDNVVDGRIEDPIATSNQEGIESFGGTDVLVSRNVVRNIGGTALNFGSAGLPHTGIDRLEVSDNAVINSGRGLNIGPGMDASGPQNVNSVQIINNEFKDLWRTGIFVPVRSGTEIRDLRITGNTITSVGGEDSIGAAGIYFQGTPATASQPEGLALDTVVSDNMISKVRGTNAIGLLAAHYPNLTVSHNSISEIDTIGVQAIAAENLVVRENAISQIQRSGFVGHLVKGVQVVDNLFQDWDTAGLRAAGVSVSNATSGVVLKNVFKHDEAKAPAVRVESSSMNVIVFGNELLSATTFTEPFVNSGVQSNLGSFEVAAGTASIVLDADLIHLNSKVLVKQRTGAASTFSASTGHGYLRLDFESPLLDTATFRFEIATCTEQLSSAIASDLGC